MKINYKGDEIIISDFKAIEAYKIARRLETEGINFYNLFLTECADAGTKRAIELLLSEEKRHLKLFEERIEELAGPFEEKSVVDDIDTTVFGSFGEPVDLAKIVKNKAKAISLGILFERRSISFLLGCLDKTTDPETKRSFEELIKEEEKHADILRNVLKNDKGTAGVK